LVGAVVLPDPPRKGRVRAAGLAVLTLAILVGFAAERQVTDVVEDWDGYWAQRVDRIGDLLSDELDRRQLAGEAAADALVERWTLEGAPLDPAVVREIRSRYAASALALYDPDGKLVVWDGTHRGLVPEEVQRGERRQSYRDLPLFGYLYLTSEGADGSVAAAAYLLRASLPAGLDADMGDLATRFLRETGERIRITEDDPGIAEAVWDLALDDDRLLSVVLDRPGTEERADAIRARWSAVVFALGTLAWLCLAFGGPIDRTERVGAAVTLIAAGALVPLDSVETLRTLFDPMAYGLLPRGPTLGRAALVATLLFVLVPVLPPVRRVLGPVAGGVIVALAFPVMLLGVASGLGDGALASSRLEWATFQLLGSACLGLVAGLTMAAIRPGGSVRWAMWGSVAAAITLVSGVGAIVAREGVAPTALTALWGVPFVLGAFGVRALDGWRRPVGGWALSVFLASSATIPIVWGLSVEARLERGEQTLGRIAAVEDAETEERLFAFARVADSLDTAGAEDVTILYEGWRLSGLSGLGQPVRLQIERRDGSPGEGLRVAAAEGEPGAAAVPADRRRWPKGGRSAAGPARRGRRSVHSDIDPPRGSHGGRRRSSIPRELGEGGFGAARAKHGRAGDRIADRAPGARGRASLDLDRTRAHGARLAGRYRPLVLERDAVPRPVRSGSSGRAAPFCPRDAAHGPEPRFSHGGDAPGACAAG
jgi:hypothetical protein